MSITLYLDGFPEARSGRFDATPISAKGDTVGPVAVTVQQLARLQPKNRYVMLDIHRAELGDVPEDNAVGLQVALERATPQGALAILRRLGAVLAGPEHAELRQAFAQWLRWSWDKNYDSEAGADEALRGELDRLVAAGEMEAMGSLAAQRWKERQRQKEAQIRARSLAEGEAQGVTKGLTKGLTKGRAEGRAEGLENERRLLGSQAARRFGADTGERLSVLLAGVSEPERLAAVGHAIIDCGTGAELLAAARRIAGAAN